ncbi:FHA domain-containing protein, partial [Streptomyces sp. NPDC051130]|uniref:FHA domain-containing protein n=1 Tax=Streptomyces sp. NPDC051130 TaxID=3157223 RepID=UPI0034125C0D
MQIRLTVLGSRSGHQTATAPAGCDVLVTAPAGTALAAVASALAATVGGPDTGGTVVLYAGAERLDLQRRMLGEPPLVDGAVLALHTPVADAVPALPEEGLDAPQLRVVAGPDAGGVHLLHPGAVRIGRSSGADVPLDDPDVSRLHCAVTVQADGRVTVADLGSTNGTTVDGVPVGPRAVPLPPGALLRIGESTLRLAAGGEPVLALTPDMEGRLSLPSGTAAPTTPSPDPYDAAAPARAAGPTDPGAGSYGSAGPAHPAGGPTDPGGSYGSAGRYEDAGADGYGYRSGASGNAGRGGPQGQIPHPAPSRNGGSAPDPATGPRPAGAAWAAQDGGTPHPAQGRHGGP